MKEFKFKAICEQYNQVFMFAVSKEDFEKIRGKSPNKLRKNIFIKDRYNIYLSDLFENDYDNFDEYLKFKDKEYEIEIKIKEV